MLKAAFKGKHSCGNFLSCGKFCSRNSCVYRHVKCFKCGETGKSMSFCQTSNHFTTSGNICWYFRLRETLDSSEYIMFLSATSSNSHHIRKRWYISSVSLHDFIIDTGSIRFVISVEKLMLADFNAVFELT